jgi:hypothetical protein
MQDLYGWTKLREHNGVSAFSRESETSDFKTFKGEYYVDKPPNQASRYVYDNFPALNEEFGSDDVEYFQLVKRINDNMQTMACSFNPKGPVSGREMETISVYLDLGNGSYSDISVSINDDEPPRKQGNVRAVLELGLTLYDPVPGED